MLSSSSTLLNIGVVIIAIVIIAVIIWVAFLANKINKFSARFEQELMRVESLAKSQAMHQMPNRNVPMQQAVMPTETGSGMPVKNVAPKPTAQPAQVQASQTAQGMKSMGSKRGISVMQPQAQTTMPAQAGKSALKKNAGKKTKPKKHKGKPVIPFGEDKRAQDRARAAYAPNAVETDYDPDSIDFSKVQGLQGRQAPSTTMNFGNANTINVADQGAQQAQMQQPRQMQQRPQMQQQQGMQPDPRMQQASQRPSVNQAASPRTRVMGQNVNNVAPVSGVARAATTGPINGSPRQRQASPRQRVANPRARAAKQQQNATRVPSAQVQSATSQTRAGFQQLETQMREAALGSTAWIEEDKRRMEERQMRQAQRAKMSEERESAQLRREAEYIVRAHQQNR